MGSTSGQLASRATVSFRAKPRDADPVRRAMRNPEHLLSSMRARALPKRGSALRTASGRPPLLSFEDSRLGAYIGAGAAGGSVQESKQLAGVLGPRLPADPRAGTWGRSAGVCNELGDQNRPELLLIPFGPLGTENSPRQRKHNLTKEKHRGSASSHGCELAGEMASTSTIRLSLR